MSDARWRLSADPRFGPANAIINGFASIEAGDAGAFPDFRSARTLVLGTDYSGQHPTARYETYGFLLVDHVGLAPWLIDRSAVRSRHLPDGRRMSYKDLGDRCRWAALPDFLAAADRLPGLLIVVAVDRRIPTLFEKPGDTREWEPALRPLGAWPRRIRERLLRVCHLGGMIAAGLSHPGQNLQWVTDEDDIVANAKTKAVTGHAFPHVTAHFMPHTMGKFAALSTEMDGEGRGLEDFVAIADLAAGAVGSVLETYQSSGLDVGLETVPPPSNLKQKDYPLMDWLALSGQPLKRLFVAFEYAPVPQPFRVKRYLMVPTETRPAGRAADDSLA